MYKYFQIAVTVLLFFIFMTGCGSDDGNCNLGDIADNNGGTAGNATVCTPGSISACYTGAQGTLNVGACSAGTSTCDSQGQPGSCVGETLPSAEICDTVDNDCDGVVDDNCI